MTSIADADDLTIDELATHVGLPVRTIRFYAGKKLLPPPRLEGRTGLYGPAHVARLVLIRDLTQTGYTLAAVEQFLAGLPPDADPDAVRMLGTLVTPWIPEESVILTREELAAEISRPVDDQLVAQLEAGNVLTARGDGTVSMTPSQLELGRRMLALDAPLDALIEAGPVIQGHAARLAEDLQHIFRTRIMAQVDATEPEDRERLRALSDALRPLTIQAIVTAYTTALEREVRGSPTPG